MSKLETLSPINASYTGISKLNSHLEKVTTAFQNTLSRDGSTPNAMEADIDMNDNQLINLAEPMLDGNAATKRYVDDLISGEGTYLINTGALGVGWENILTLPSKDMLGFYVDSYGATGNGTTDDTTAIQAAFTAARLNGGGSVHFTAGKTYRTSQSILMGSNTVIYLHGATVRALAGWVGTVANNNYQMFRNYNHLAVAITDYSIYLFGPGTLDFNNVAIVGGGAHLFSCRMTRGTGAYNVTFQNGENGTALLACEDMYTRDCVGRNLTNCHFDHWDGSGFAYVVNCRAVNDGGVSGAQGIQFTGTGTFAENRTSSDCVVSGCYVKGIKGMAGSSSAIISNANDADSATFRFRSHMNTIEDCDLGLVWSGEGGQHISQSDTIINVLGIPIFMQIANTDSPDNCHVIDPLLVDCDHAPGNIALIAITGNNTSVTGVKIVNSGAALYNLIAWFTSTASNCRLEIADGASGAGGRVQNNGTNCRVIDQFRRYEEGTFTPTLQFGGASVGMTYGIRVGVYTRVGDTVFVSGSVQLSAKGSSTGTAGLATMPVGGAATNSPGGGVCSYSANMAGLTSPIVLAMSPSGGGFAMSDSGAGGTTQLDDTNFTNNSIFFFSATYKAVS